MAGARLGQIPFKITALYVVVFLIMAIKMEDIFLAFQSAKSIFTFRTVWKSVHSHTDRDICVTKLSWAYPCCLYGHKFVFRIMIFAPHYGLRPFFMLGLRSLININYLTRSTQYGILFSMTFQTTPGSHY